MYEIILRDFFNSIVRNPFIIVTASAICLDTILGLLRAIKEHGFNSCFGIDGAIRKSGMIVSVLFLMFTDFVVKINCIFFVPQEIREALGLTKVGMGEFFCILFTLYEAVSILKNMYLCDMPIPQSIKKWLEKFLLEMTREVAETRKEKIVKVEEEPEG